MQHSIHQQPTYDPIAVQPMRDELVAVGCEELITPEDIDRVLGNNDDKTTLILINSVCGCAAGSARASVALALQHNTIPDHFTTVFAGQDKAAVAHLREQYLGDLPPSSPLVVLFKNKKVVFILQRHDIERRYPEELAKQMTTAFDKECSNKGPSITPDDYAKVVHAVSCGSKIPKFNTN